MLESCDKSFFSKLFRVPATCSNEAAFLETGCLPIRFILRGRRVMYLWTLLNKNEEELVKKVFNIQKEYPIENDWKIQVDEDLELLGITLSEGSIKAMKKEKFKKLVKEKLEEKAAEYLAGQRDKHSKTQGLTNYGYQGYLSSPNLSTREKQLLFSLRTRSLDVKTNYKNKYILNLTCSLCKNPAEAESEIHLINCESIKSKIGAKVDLTSIKYENIFSENVYEQEKVVKAFTEILKARKIL